MIRPRFARSHLTTSMLLVTLALAACEVAEAPGSTDASTRDTLDANAADSATQASDADAAGDAGPETTDAGLLVCDPTSAAPNGGCPSGQLCETTAHVCVDCIIAEERCVAGQRESCEAPVVTGVHAVSGGSWHADACAHDEACVPVGIHATCEPQVCDPDPTTWRCLSATTARQCNAFGNEQQIVECQPGRACYEGKCEFIRHNVVVVFDTSGSMHDYLDRTFPGNPGTCDQNHTPCLQPFPACDDPADPLTLFTLAKTVFADVIETTIGGFSQFALERFPQREAATNNPGCFVGFYTTDTEMTGDDESKVPGAWFDQNLGEVLVVPFPLRNSLDNKAKLLEWLDFSERLGATDTACTTNDQCGTGKCGQVNGEGRCFHHTDDELRANGETPLGKSLFYAAEYIRRYVRVDGKACTTDASCGSAGYQCVSGFCKDPYRKCKDDFIVLFTDGEESFFQDETSFFNPAVQAKRMAYGLDCTADADCRGGAVCTNHVCLGPGQTAGDVPTLGGDGFGALSSPDGQPISIRTTVITLDGQGVKNARIAHAGGGVNVDVQSSDPQTMRTQLIQAMTPNFKCRPEDLR
ncbi:MAG: hypothetical protein U1F43_14665 [Myxococcota bacterium]